MYFYKKRSETIYADLDLMVSDSTSYVKRPDKAVSMAGLPWPGNLTKETPVFAQAKGFPMEGKGILPSYLAFTASTKAETAAIHASSVTGSAEAAAVAAGSGALGDAWGREVRGRAGEPRDTGAGPDRDKAYLRPSRRSVSSMIWLSIASISA